MAEVGNLKVKWSRPLPGADQRDRHQGQRGRYFLSFVVDTDPEHLPELDTETISPVLDRLGRHRTVALAYALAAAGVGLLAWATASGSALWVTLAFVAANGFATAAWSCAYPTFTELFPTHLRGAGVGFSVAVGRIGAIIGTLALPDLAAHLGATASYLLVVACWLAGVAAIGIFRLRGGIDAANRSLESLNPTST